MNKEIHIEGVCTSGKSTLGKRLEEQNDERYAYIPEYSQIDTKNTRRERIIFPPATTEDARNAFMIFLELDERRRFETIDNLPGKTIKVIDRGIVSVVAFEYAMYAFNNKNVLRESFDLLAHYFENKEQKLPNGWLYIRFGNIKTFKERVNNKNEGLLFLLQPQTASFIQKYYDTFFEFVDSNRILTLMAEGNITDMINKATVFIEEKCTEQRISPEEFLSILKKTINKLSK